MTALPDTCLGAPAWVVAPSSPFPRLPVYRGLAWLRSHLALRFAPSFHQIHRGHLAGSDARRLAELQAAMDDPEAATILCARGGYGLQRLLPQLDFTGFLRHPKWFIGFSDLTAFHAELWARGVPSIHGPHVSWVAPACSTRRHGFLDLLTRPGTGRSLKNLEPWVHGEAEGTLIGGNLTMIASVAAAGRLVVPQGAILALEDTTEAPYRLDRCLTTLLLGGHLERLGGIVLGDFDRCHPGHHGVPTPVILRDLLEPLAIPILANAPFGHTERNEPLLLGRRARLSAETGELFMGLD